MIPHATWAAIDAQVKECGPEPIIKQHERVRHVLEQGLATKGPMDGPVGWREYWQQQVDDTNEILVYLRNKVPA